MLKLVYPACFYPCEDMKGHYTVVVPDLPGCVTEGKDLADAIDMAIDAASLWILTTLEDGDMAPKPTLDTSKIDLEYPDGFVNYIMLDIDEYAEKYGNKAVRKNLTIPAWLNSIAENQHVNFSETLQAALMEKLDIAQ